MVAALCAYTYEVNDGEVTITGTQEPASGHIAIPATIDGYPVTAIGRYAFDMERDLLSVSIPDGVKTLQEGAFAECTSLRSVSIPDSVTTICNEVFYHCDNLTTVTIPSSVTELAAGAFYYCISLQSILVDENNPNYSSDAYGVLFNKEKTKLLCAPSNFVWTDGSYTIPDSVHTIQSGAFAFCTNLGSVQIPSSVTTIGSSAFSWCDNLTSIVIPNSITKIEDYTFEKCSRLESVEIPNTVTEIGMDAFSECTSLTDITIPDSVTTIQNWAFSFCHGLTTVKIPASVTYIGEDAFRYARGLTAIRVDADNPNYSSDSSGVLYNKEKTKVIMVPTLLGGDYRISTGVTAIANKMFADCPNLLSVVVPDTVTTVGESAFAGCTGLISVVIGKYVEKSHATRGTTNVSTQIQASAFEGCSNLETITIGNNVTSIGESAFSNCNNLTQVTYCGTEEQWNAVTISDGNAALLEAELQYHDFEDGICTVCGEEDAHKHEWAEGVCTVCGQSLAEAMDLNGDGKVTAFDAQILAEANAGCRELTEKQKELIGELTAADIVDYVLGRPITEE